MKQFPHTSGHHLFKVSILAIALFILMALYLVYSKLEQSIAETEKKLNSQMHSVNSTLMADLEIIQDKQLELLDKVNNLNQIPAAEKPDPIHPAVRDASSEEGNDNPGKD